MEIGVPSEPQRQLCAGGGSMCVEDDDLAGKRAELENSPNQKKLEVLGFGMLPANGSRQGA